MNILAVIPARGGSKGIPRKNVRLLNGQPLIAYAIKNALASRFDMDVCVSTDDTEIAQIAQQYGAEIIKRSGDLSSDEVTLDPVIFDAYQKMKEQSGQDYDLIITLQATSPLLKVKTLDAAIDYMMEEKQIDTLISAVNHPHLSWGQNDQERIVPNYEKRLNRQYLPAHFVETGAFLMTRSSSIQEHSRMGQEVAVFEVDENEAVDVDTAQDWWVAEKELSKKHILIRVEAYSEIGLGHVYRGLSLAYQLIDHQVEFVTSAYSDLAIQKLEASFLPYTVIQEEDQLLELIEENKIDIVINDILDTQVDYIQKLKAKDIRVVNFEDLGPGGRFADAVINDLYAPQPMGDHYYWGSHYYLLRDEFLISQPQDFQPEVRRLLVIFGGVDPSNLSSKLISAFNLLGESCQMEFDVIVGPGYPQFDSLKKQAQQSKHQIKVIQNVQNMASYMKKADLAVSSQGRTMLELASMAVPTILLAQNERELTHDFGYLPNGFINLGLGSALDEQTIANTIQWLIETDQIRQQMHEQMKEIDLRHGIDRVKGIILGE